MWRSAGRTLQTASKTTAHEEAAAVMDSSGVTRGSALIMSNTDPAWSREA